MVEVNSTQTQEQKKNIFNFFYFKSRFQIYFLNNLFNIYRTFTNILISNVFLITLFFLMLVFVYMPYTNVNIDQHIKKIKVKQTKKHSILKNIFYSFLITKNIDMIGHNLRTV